MADPREKDRGRAERLCYAAEYKDEDLAAFIAQALADERERCAEEAEAHKGRGVGGSGFSEGWDAAVFWIARSIRAGGAE